MLHFSAKGEYAVLAILALSLYSGKSPLQVKAISQMEDIPLRFLEQVMSLLKKRGLVESMRGAHGGYRLTKAPDQIFLGEVLQAVEGPSSPADLSGARDREKRIESRVLREIWTEVNETLTDQLNAISFSDLCERKWKLEKPEALMYHI